jgi:hypothetical protein
VSIQSALDFLERLSRETSLRDRLARDRDVLSHEDFRHWGAQEGHVFTIDQLARAYQLHWRFRVSRRRQGGS